MTSGQCQAKKSITPVSSARLGGITGSTVGSWKPVFTIHVDGQKVRLEDLKFPAGLQVLAPSGMRKKLLHHLTSEDPYVRAYTVSEIVEREPYTDENVDVLLKVTQDPDEYVRRSAAGVLAQLGKNAESALDDLRSHTPGSYSENVSFANAIKIIEGATSPPTLSTEEEQILKEIEAKFGMNEPDMTIPEPTTEIKF